MTISADNVKFRNTSTDTMSFTSLLDLIYPVGSIYIQKHSSTDTPASLFGGSWTQFSENYYLLNVATSDADSSRNAVGHTHMLSPKYGAAGYFTCNASVSGSPNGFQWGFAKLVTSEQFSESNAKGYLSNINNGGSGVNIANVSVDATSPYPYIYLITKSSPKWYSLDDYGVGLYGETSPYLTTFSHISGGSSSTGEYTGSITSSGCQHLVPHYNAHMYYRTA